jgi:tetratricopeptide (TPR) repeat protein
LCSCRTPIKRDQAAEYSRIHAEFLRAEDLKQARREAAERKTEWLADDPVWSYQFRLLEAEILGFQGKSREVVDVLDRQAPGFAPTGDVEIKKLTLLSLADARLGQAQRSAAELQQAQSLSAGSHSPLVGEVLLVEGLLENRNGRAADAEKSLRASLALARLRQDDYLAALDLLNLGYIALQAERIDEALGRFTSSSQLAAKINANLILHADLGNAGWAYFKLGDFEGALESFRQAQAKARNLGATDSEIIWLQSAGRALTELGDLRQAEASYEQAMRAAQASHEAVREAENQTALGLLFLKRGQLDAAKAHANAALLLSRQLQDRSAEMDALLLQALVASAADAPDAQSLLVQLLHNNSE